MHPFSSPLPSPTNQVAKTLYTFVYENWVFTVTGSSSLAGVVLHDSIVGVGVCVGVALFDGDDEFICRIFIFED